MEINKSAFNLMLLAEKEKVDFYKVLALDQLGYCYNKDLKPTQYTMANSSSPYSENHPTTKELLQSTKVNVMSVTTAILKHVYR